MKVSNRHSVIFESHVTTSMQRFLLGLLGTTQSLSQDIVQQYDCVPEMPTTIPVNVHFELCLQTEQITDPSYL